MLTSTRKETTIQYLAPYVQDPLRGASSAPDPGRIVCRHVGSGRNGAIPNAGVQAVRGETGFGRRHRGRASDPESGASRVFVLDRCGAPLMPCHPARARKLLKKGRAVVVRLHPFTIRLRDRVGGEAQEVGLKVDPGAKTTGLALVREDGEVLFLAEIEHRGERIRKSMRQRAGYRRRRRTCAIARKALREKAPALAAVAGRQRGLVDGAAAQARARDLHRVRGRPVRHPGAGEPGDRGRGVPATLAGCEVRECLLEKWGRTCAYCGATDTPLQIDHVRPKAAGGSDRVSNLALACPSCNQAKGAQPVEAFLAGRPERLRRVLAQAKRRSPPPPPSTPPAASCALKRTGLPVRSSTARGWGSRSRMPSTPPASARRRR